MKEGSRKPAEATRRMNAWDSGGGELGGQSMSIIQAPGDFVGLNSFLVDKELRVPG